MDNKTTKCIIMSRVSTNFQELDIQFKKGIEVALLAPTAINQQKFSFEYAGMSKNRHQVKAKKGFSMIGYTKMDLGIAKKHFEIRVGNVNYDWP